MVQWLRLHASNAGDAGLIPGWGTRSHMPCGAVKKKLSKKWASQVVLVVENLSTPAGDMRDAGLILGSGRSPGEGNSNPLQYSCLENPMDRGPGGLQFVLSHRVGHD